MKILYLITGNECLNAAVKEFIAVQQSEGREVSSLVLQKENVDYDGLLDKIFECGIVCL